MHLRIFTFYYEKMVGASCNHLFCLLLLPLRFCSLPTFRFPFSPWCTPRCQCIRDLFVSIFTKKCLDHILISSSRKFLLFFFLAKYNSTFIHFPSEKTDPQISDTLQVTLLELYLIVRPPFLDETSLSLNP